MKTPLALPFFVSVFCRDIRSGLKIVNLFYIYKYMKYAITYSGNENALITSVHNTLLSCCYKCLCLYITVCRYYYHQLWSVVNMCLYVVVMSSYANHTLCYMAYNGISPSGNTGSSYNYSERVNHNDI